MTVSGYTGARGIQAPTHGTEAERVASIFAPTAHMIGDFLPVPTHGQTQKPVRKWQPNMLILQDQGLPVEYVPTQPEPVVIRLN